MGFGRLWVRIRCGIEWAIGVACASACQSGGSSPIVGGVLTGSGPTNSGLPLPPSGPVTSSGPGPTTALTATSVTEISGAEPETSPSGASLSLESGSLGSQGSEPQGSASTPDTSNVFFVDAGTSTAAESSTAPTTPIDCEETCAAAGGSCQAGVCVFTCGEMDACPDAIRCPDNLDCRVECTGGNSCGGGVACPTAGAQLCDVQCGQDACKGGVVCGGANCNVDCANGACRGVSGSANNFTLNCTGDGSCSDATLSCNAQNCNMTCSGSGACMRGDINISANNATLACQGNGSCSQAINCSAGSCNITCNTSVSACSSYCQSNGGQSPNGCP